MSIAPRYDWIQLEANMKKIILVLVPTLLVGCMSHNRNTNSPRVSYVRENPCPSPSAHALRQVDDIKRILTDTNGVMTQYRVGLGVDGVEPGSVASVTDSRTCSAATAAVSSYLRRLDPMAENLYVVKVGPRYIAMDARTDAPAQYVLTKKFEVTDYLVP